MNVVQAVPPRGRRGYTRGRATVTNEAQRVTNIFPKYQFDTGFLRPPVNSGPSSSNNAKTPKYRKENYISTSSGIPSVSRRNIGSATRTKSTSYCASSNVNSWVIIALTAGRGDARNEVGLAAIDLQYPYLILCQISDCQTYINTLTKINIFDPVEILMPETMCTRRGYGNKLYKSIQEKFPTINITPISRIHFNEMTGMERVRTLCAREYSTVELIAKQKYYALAATAALLKYVEYVQHIVYAPKSLRIEFQGSPNTTIIDIESARSLELVVSQSKHSTISLLGTMDRCLTPMGRRLLRASILQPPCNKHLIADRQSCVAELVANHSLRLSIQPVVQRLFGTDRLLALAIKPLHINDMQNAERNLNYALLLKHCLDTVPELKAVLEIGIHPSFVKIRQNLGNSEFPVMKDKILTLLHTDARFVKGCTSSSIQRCFAIKANINELLDVARQIYCELINDMKNLVEQLALKHKLPLSLEYNANLGYHIQLIIPRNRDITISSLPTEFIQPRKNKTSITMTTTTLLTLNKQCKSACDEVYLISNALLTNLLEDIRQHVGCLFQLSTDVAELDLILSLAQISSNPEYIRPSFGTKLELINSLHPIMELFNTDLPVANNVNASIRYNFHLITGPNMSGKSTYLKQIVLLQIMAQIGSYIPATKAIFRIADRILCKICSRDDAELNASSYVLEMKEIQYILQSVTPNSLVILDELCRHTKVDEGSAIAWSICEKLLLTTAFTFAATHFVHLTALSNMYYNVTIYCFETKTAESDELRLIYTHKLNKGTGPTDHYGIALAEVSSLPKCVTIKARNYALQTFIGTQDHCPSVSNFLSWKKVCYDALIQLHTQIEDNQFTFVNIISVIKQLDLEKQHKTLLIKSSQEKIQIIKKSIAYNSENKTEIQQKYDNDTSIIYRTKSIDAHVETTKISSTKLSRNENKNHPNLQINQHKQQMENELMQVNDNPISTMNIQKTNLSTHETINPTITALPVNATNENLVMIGSQYLSQLATNVINSNITTHTEQSPCYEITNDPRFYVCTSFSINDTPNTTISSQYGTNLTSNITTNTATGPSPVSCESSQSYPYYDYCLSEKDFDISQSISSDQAKMNTCRMETEIFREIEGDAFDEKAFLDSIQTPLNIDFSHDDE